MSNKHTPGPWEADCAKDGPLRYHQIDAARVEEKIGTDYPYTVSDTMNRHHTITPEEDESNARLIAAAPELLEALKWFIAALENGLLVRDITKDAQSDWALKMMHFVRDLQKATLAVAKAEGRQ